MIAEKVVLSTHETLKDASQQLKALQTQDAIENAKVQMHIYIYT